MICPICHRDFNAIITHLNQEHNTLERQYLPQEGDIKICPKCLDAYLETHVCSRRIVECALCLKPLNLKNIKRHLVRVHNIPLEKQTKDMIVYYDHTQTKVLPEFLNYPPPATPFPTFERIFTCPFCMKQIKGGITHFNKYHTQEQRQLIHDSTYIKELGLEFCDQCGLFCEKLDEHVCSMYRSKNNQEDELKEDVVYTSEMNQNELNQELVYCDACQTFYPQELFDQHLLTCISPFSSPIDYSAEMIEDLSPFSSFELIYCEICGKYYEKQDYHDHLALCRYLYS